MINWNKKRMISAPPGKTG
jgi:hypothetical protein